LTRGVTRRKRAAICQLRSRRPCKAHDRSGPIRIRRDPHDPPRRLSRLGGRRSSSAG
jgi:hypothetical protein